MLGYGRGAGKGRDPELPCVQFNQVTETKIFRIENGHEELSPIFRRIRNEVDRALRAHTYESELVVFNKAVAYIVEKTPLKEANPFRMYAEFEARAEVRKALAICTDPNPIRSIPVLFFAQTYMNMLLTILNVDPETALLRDIHVRLMFHMLAESMQNANEFKQLVAYTLMSPNTENRIRI